MPAAGQSVLGVLKFCADFVMCVGTLGHKYVTSGAIWALHDWFSSCSCLFNFMALASALLLTLLMGIALVTKYITGYIANED